ncbi:hypothetical protein ACHWQZ_G004238 [Mnemiopsis leidyi]
MDNSNICSVEKLTETIKLVENLRATVYVVFDELVGGKTINDGIKDHRTINDKEKGKKMVANLHLNLQNGVNKALNMLESSMSSLGRYPLSALPHNPGFHLLSLETTDSAGQELYETLHNDYMHVYKICDNSGLMFKSLTRNMKIPNTQDIEPISQTNIYHTIKAPRSHLESFVANMNQRFGSSGGSQVLKLNLMKTSSGNMLKAIVGTVLKANIMMQGLLVDRVVVHSFNEETTNENIWPPSKFIVFNRLTEIANSAALYYGSSSKFFFWLSYYQNLYSQPCKSCGKILMDENNRDRYLPPVRRDFVHQDMVYHLSCYQSNDEL